MRDLLAQGRREDRAIAYLMIACFLIFVAQWPRLSREAYAEERLATVLTEEQMATLIEGWSAFSRLMTYEFLAWVMLWPLFLYILAALTHVVAKALGGQGDWYGARVALFWSMLASIPLLLLHGLTAGFIGPGMETNVVGAAWVVAFGVIWIQCLREAESGK